MLQKSDKGKEARQYFIECERKLQQTIEKPSKLSMLEMMRQSIDFHIEADKRLREIETRVEAIENSPVVNADIQNFSIMGYCRNIHRQINLDEAKKYGSKCRKLCKEHGYAIGIVPDPRFGTVNTYPLDVLSDVIGE